METRSNRMIIIACSYWHNFRISRCWISFEWLPKIKMMHIFIKTSLRQRKTKNIYGCYSLWLFQFVWRIDSKKENLLAFDLKTIDSFRSYFFAFSQSVNRSQIWSQLDSIYFIFISFWVSLRAQQSTVYSLSRNYKNWATFQINHK